MRAIIAGEESAEILLEQQDLQLIYAIYFAYVSEPEMKVRVIALDIPLQLGFGFPDVFQKVGS